MSFESITEIWTYCTQRDVVWEHYRNLNLLHSTRCRLRALQKSELIALNEMSFESLTEIWTYYTQRYDVWEHYRNLKLLHSVSLESLSEIWTYCYQRDVVWEHYRNLNLLHSTRCRLRALHKTELIALNKMSFESTTEIWTYCTQTINDVVWEHYRNLNLLHSTRCRLRALQKSELIALNEMSI